MKWLLRSLLYGITWGVYTNVSGLWMSLWHASHLKHKSQRHKKKQLGSTPHLVTVTTRIINIITFLEENPNQNFYLPLQVLHPGWGGGRSKKQQPLHLPKLVKKWYSSGVVPNLNGFRAWKIFVSDPGLKVSDQRLFQEGLKQGGIYKTIA